MNTFDGLGSHSVIDGENDKRYSSRNSRMLNRRLLFRFI
jgi:hypothetical protein